MSLKIMAETEMVNLILYRIEKIWVYEARALGKKRCGLR